MVSCRSGIRQRCQETRTFPCPCKSATTLTDIDLPHRSNSLSASVCLCVCPSVRLSVSLIDESSFWLHFYLSVSVSLSGCVSVSVSGLVNLLLSVFPLRSLSLPPSSLSSVESPAIRSTPFAPSAAAAVSGASASSPSSAPAPNQVIRSSPPRPTRPSTECRQLHSYQADSWQSATDRKPICPNTARSHAGCASLHSCQADVGPNTLARWLTRVRASMPA